MPETTGRLIWNASSICLYTRNPHAFCCYLYYHIQARYLTSVSTVLQVRTDLFRIRIDSLPTVWVHKGVLAEPEADQPLPSLAPRRI